MKFIFSTLLALTIITVLGGCRGVDFGGGQSSPGDNGASGIPQSTPTPIPQSPENAYVLWAKDGVARIVTLSATDGSVLKSVDMVGPAGYRPRNFEKLADGTGRLLFNGTSSACIYSLDSSLNIINIKYLASPMAGTDWIASHYARINDSSKDPGRLIWFRMAGKDAVVQRLDVKDDPTAAALQIYTASTLGYFPIRFHKHQGKARLLWTRTNSPGLNYLGGHAVLWELDANEGPIAVSKQFFHFEPNWYARGYHIESDSSVRLLWGYDFSDHSNFPSQGQIWHLSSSDSNRPTNIGWNEIPSYAPYSQSENGWWFRSCTK